MIQIPNLQEMLEYNLKIAREIATQEKVKHHSYQKHNEILLNAKAELGNKDNLTLEERKVLMEIENSLLNNLKEFEKSVKALEHYGDIINRLTVEISKLELK